MMTKTSKTVIGIDNGPSGSIAILFENGESYFYKTPVINCLDYTKTKKHINRINFDEINRLFKNIKDTSKTPILAGIERPMVNSQRFNASLSAIRALESYIIALDMIGIPYLFLDSKQWQGMLLPKGLESKELKSASRDVGLRLFPQHADLIKKHKDADGLLIAEWLRTEC